MGVVFRHGNRVSDMANLQHLDMTTQICVYFKKYVYLQHKNVCTRLVFKPKQLNGP